MALSGEILVQNHLVHVYLHWLQTFIIFLKTKLLLYSRVLALGVYVEVLYEVVIETILHCNG